MKRVTTILLIQIGILLACSNNVWANQREESNHTIVPGVGIGDYMLGMSKDEVLKKLRDPESIQFRENEIIHRGQAGYSLNKLPNIYVFYYADMWFLIKHDSVVLISVRSPLYKLNKGLKVGDSEQKIKQAFGEDLRLREDEGKEYLLSDAEKLAFEINKKNRTVTEILVFQPESDRGGREDKQGPDVERRRDDRAGQRETPKVIMLSDQPQGPITLPKIDRRPKPDRWGRDEIKSLPKYDPALRNPGQVDLRSLDLSKLDLRNSIENLRYADFDDRTVWPTSDKMPHGFTWQKFMELGKNPGLDVRTLHERGITGKGVGVAIIDQSLLTEHREYADRLRLYEENNIRDRDTASMHGAAVTSIAAGRTVGVAPDADLYYIATWDLTRDDDRKYNFVFRAQSIRRILEINRQLPANRKIRVISNSIAWSPSQEGYDEITAACAEARAAGIFVVTCGIIEPYGFDFGGLGRDPLANPDSFESRGPCLDWIQIFFRSAPGRDSDTLWVPEDSRTTASPTGRDEYVFYRQGGASWCAPYIAGMYALAAQVDAGITPEKFWNLAMKTGRTIQVEHEGQTRSFGPIIDPVKLISSISEDAAASQQAPSKNSIVPGVGVGDYTLGMSKDEVTRKLEEPYSIRIGRQRYPLNDLPDNLPRRYTMSCSDFSFQINEGTVTVITVRSPLYKFTNGLGVGDSEEKIKQAFGSNFQLEEYEFKDLLNYEDKGIQFEIRNTDKKVVEINVYQAKNNHADNPKPKVDGHHELRAFENVCGKDLRACDLHSAGDILDTLEFNQQTLWPPSERLPEGFDPKVLLQEGMNPGLGVRALHAQGITGTGVHVGLIDQPLLLDHPEYDGKIVSYHALDCGPHKSSGHGPGMASQLVGKQCGTAPGASLHVVAVPSWKADADYYARALDRFVAYNENAPKEQKIRVVSVSCQPSGEGSVYENQPLWDEAVQRAQTKGILVLDCTWHHGFVSLCWLDPQNRESVEACTPGFRLGEVEVDAGHIHAPSAPRTVAQADENRTFGYAYDGGGRRSRRPRAKNGYSDTIPYAAGILALGWQIHPDLTPAQIKDLLFASAYVHESGAKIIHPKAFIDMVRKQSENQQPEHSASKDVSTLVRQAAAQGRISFKLTTPEEFKEIAGQPNREWMEADDELIYMEYSGVQVGFFGKPEINTPHTITTLRCEGRRIDIGNNRPIVLRNEGDLDKFGSYWGYSSVDLSRLDLSKKDNLLKAMSFDSLTVWPESNRLPASFDPEAVMEWGKNPGLGIRSLHKKGITGHGVSIAILDQPLLVDHQEYSERVRLYEEIHIQSGEGPASHGAAVVSIAIGKTVGVATEAELYYIAQLNYDWEKKKFTPTLRYLVQGVHRILEVNKQLPKGNKIRVISISKGWEPSEDGYDDIMAACEEAKAEGIFVASCSLERVYGFNFAGLGRNPLASPDLFESYEPGLFWAKGFYNGRTGFGSGFLLVPMDSRTTASPAGSDKYVLYRQGGLSWSVPYIAGVYALAVQVEPEITPERFWNLALKTGRTIELEHKGEKHPFGPIINPVALIGALQGKAYSKGDLR